MVIWCGTGVGCRFGCRGIYGCNAPNGGACSDDDTGIVHDPDRGWRAVVHDPDRGWRDVVHDPDRGWRAVVHDPDRGWRDVVHDPDRGRRAIVHDLGYRHSAPAGLRSMKFYRTLSG